MFAPLARSDQRRWGECYVRGLMLDGKRKSIEPMAARLQDGDEQCLQQFLNQSPWPWQPVRERLAQKLTAVIEPQAWIVDDTGFPKFGRHSVGVARQYSGTLGKIGNCQIGVSINAATDAASCPLDWRLFLPAEWDEDVERRARAHLPPEERHRPKWRLALELLDELRGWGLEPPVICADAAYGEITAFRLGLEARELEYVLQVQAQTSAARCAHSRSPPAERRSRSPGVRAPRAGSARASSPSACARPTRRFPATSKASYRSAGCSANGHSAPPSRSSTGSRTSPPRSRSNGSSGSPSCAGGSSTTTAS